MKCPECNSELEICDDGIFRQCYCNGCNKWFLEDEL